MLIKLLYITHFLYARILEKLIKSIIKLTALVKKMVNKFKLIYKF